MSGTIKTPYQISKCNKLFVDPTKSPRTGLELTKRTQRKYMRRCKVPINNVRIYCNGVAPGKDIVDRLRRAGGDVVDNIGQANYVIEDLTSGPDASNKNVMRLTLERFLDLYKDDLYSECERFRLDPKRAPNTGFPIVEGARIYKRWVRKCKNDNNEVVIIENLKPLIIDASGSEASVMNMSTNNVNEGLSVRNVANSLKKERVRVKDPKEAIINKLKRMCMNDIDPVTLDKLADLEIDQLKQIVMIGEDDKRKHCMLADSAYGVYEKAARAGVNARNPLNPSYTFNEAEINNILRLSKRKRIVKLSAEAKDIFRMRFFPETINKTTYNRVAITMPLNSGGEYEVYSLGFIPSEQEADVSKKLVKLLNAGRLLELTDEGGIRVMPGAISLRRPLNYWSKGDKKKELRVKIIEFINAVNKL